MADRGKVHCLRRAPPAGDIFHASVCGDQEWLSFSIKTSQSPSQPNKQGLTVLHVAAQNGQMNCMKLLVESGFVDVNASCPRGCRPLHMVLCPQSKPHSHTCLTYLLQHGAKHDISTDEGLTPLHIAASEGLTECVQTLVAVGANTHACDNRGHTPLDLARIWGHRAVARFLKNVMWQREKKKDMERRKALHNLKQNLIQMHRSADCKTKVAREALNEQKVSEWAQKKGLPLLWTPLKTSCTSNHSCCPSGEPPKTKCEKKCASGASRKAWSISTNPSRPPPASISRPQEVRLGIHLEEEPEEPDLHQSVTLGCFEDGRLHCTGPWDNNPQPVPVLPLDVVQKSLFPCVFPSRITSPLSFQSNNVLDLPHRGCTTRPGASPWTEVAMHLVEKLERGHY